MATGYTSRRLPVELVWAEHFPDITDAIAVERQLKGWSRAKKEALIKGDYASIKILAKRPCPLPILRDGAEFIPKNEVRLLRIRMR